MAQQEHEHEHHSAGRYYMSFAVLLVLTALTYILALQERGEWSFFIAMAIALTKGSFVVLFFMHLIDQPGANRLTFVVSVVFVLVLITLTCSDVMTRWRLSLPPGAFQG